MFILLNNLFYFYQNKKKKYFSFISKMNYFFIKKNNLYSFDHLFLFFYRNNLLCKSILNLFLKYKFKMPLMVYPFEFEQMFNGRTKNALIGRR